MVFLRLILISIMLSACVKDIPPPPMPAPLIIPTPDQQNGADRGHSIEKDTH